MKDDYTVPILTISPIHCSLQGWKNVLLKLGSERVECVHERTRQGWHMPSHRFGWNLASLKGSLQNYFSPSNSKFEQHGGGGGELTTPPCFQDQNQEKSPENSTKCRRPSCTQDLIDHPNIFYQQYLVPNELDVRSSVLCIELPVNQGLSINVMARLRTPSRPKWNVRREVHDSRKLTSKGFSFFAVPSGSNSLSNASTTERETSMPRILSLCCRLPCTQAHTPRPIFHHVLVFSEWSLHAPTNPDHSGIVTRQSSIILQQYTVRYCSKGDMNEQ